MRSSLRFLTLLSCLVLLGCGEKKGPQIDKKPTVPVSGIISYKDRPVANAGVTFHSIDGKFTASGLTDAAGTYNLKSYGTSDGAPVGNYKVTVAVSGTQEIAPGVLAPEPPGGFKSPIPTNYANPATTDITKEVKEGSNTINIDLK